MRTALPLMALLTACGAEYDLRISFEEDAARDAAHSVQLAIIAGWRKTTSFKQFSLASNTGLIVAGIFLFLMQMHGYGHNANPDDFAISSDNHYHEHQKMDAEIVEKQKSLRKSIF